jgi:hypothetical protein
LKRGKARKAKDTGTKAQVAIAIPHFGCKNQIGIARCHGFILCYAVTSADFHDGGQCQLAAAWTRTTPPARSRPDAGAKNRCQ